MNKLNSNSPRFRNTLTVTNLLFAVMAGCGLPSYGEGEICDQALTLEWSEARDNADLDSVDFVTWTEDPAVEQELLSYGLIDAKDFLGGNDVNEDGIVVSPYGKTMNAYEFIVKTPGLEGWGDFLRTKSYPVRLSCGVKSQGIVAYTYFGRKKKQETHLYQEFYKRNVVSRAGFLIHEAGHAAGMPNHVANGAKDQSWETDGPYRLQLEFLAAVFYAEGTSYEHKMAAAKEFNWMIKSKFVEKTELTLASFAPSYEKGKRLGDEMLAAAEASHTDEDQAQDHFVPKCGSEEAL